MQAAIEQSRTTHKESVSLLVMSHDIVGPNMAGPGIRYWSLVQVLAQHFNTVLAAPPGSSMPNVETQNLASLRIYEPGVWESIAPSVMEADAVILSGDPLLYFPQLQHCGRPLIIDGYDPHTIETLFMWRRSLPLEAQLERYHERLRLLSLQSLVGDFFLCASETQRLWWLGVLETHGRINPYTLEGDPTLERLIAVVPFGLPSKPFPYGGGIGAVRAGQAGKHKPPLPRGEGWAEGAKTQSGAERAKAEGAKAQPGAQPGGEGDQGISPEDKVLLWGGGLWEWLDPLSAIRAMPKVLAQRSHVKLLFPGTRHPNPDIPPMPKVAEAQSLVADLGLAEHVVFGDWVPREEWPHYLGRADIGLSLHLDSIEACLAFRSRLLEYIWAGLPMVVNPGDETSALVARYQLGSVVEYEDPAAIAEAIIALLDIPKEHFREQFAQAREALSWERAAQPLVDFCYNIRYAADKEALGTEAYTSGGRIGNPYYLARACALIEERDQWRNLAKRYEQGRFMRFMKWLHSLRGGKRKL